MDRWLPRILKVVGVLALGLGVQLWGWKYMLFCCGCALVQVTQLNFPKSQREVGPAYVTIIDLDHPLLFVGMRLTLTLLAVTSVVAEIWIGVHLFPWWPGSLIFLLPTVGVDLVAPRISRLKGIVLGLVLACASGIMLLAG